MSERLKSAVGLLVVVMAALFLRLPPLLNAGAVNSDAAVVGLQAIALLDRGEFDIHLWDANYQTSLDVLLAAGLFRVLGPTPWALYLVPYIGAALATTLIFLTLRRGLSAPAATLLTLTVSFGSQAITSPMTLVVRQTMVVVVVLGVWLAHRASATRFGLVQLFAGAACFGLAIFVDVYATMIWPAGALFALACCFDRRFDWKRLAATVAGLAAGLFAAFLVGHVGSDTTPDLAWRYARSSWRLFVEQCLPFALSLKVWIPGANLYPDLWQSPAVWRMFSFVAVALLALLWITPLGLVFARRLDWPTRRLGLFGLVAGGLNALAFIFSRAPADMWSVRYLALLMWTLPFALAPIASRVRPRILAVLLGPYLAVALVGGWLSWGAYVHGPFPSLDARGRATEEYVVIDEVIKRGATAAGAEYWLAYKFTLLSRERLPTVPLDGPDRYAPYRRKYDEAKKVALIFHPLEPRLLPGPYANRLRSQGVQFETIRIGDFTVFLVDRTAKPK